MASRQADAWNPGSRSTAEGSSARDKVRASIRARLHSTPHSSRGKLLGSRKSWKTGAGSIASVLRQVALRRGLDGPYARPTDDARRGLARGFRGDGNDLRRPAGREGAANRQAGLPPGLPVEMPGHEAA